MLGSSKFRLNTGTVRTGRNSEFYGTISSISSMFQFVFEHSFPPVIYSLCVWSLFGLYDRWWKFLQATIVSSQAQKRISYYCLFNLLHLLCIYWLFVRGFRAHSCTAMSWAQYTRPHRRYPWWRSYNIRNYPPTASYGTWQSMRKPKPSRSSKAWGFGVGHQQCTLSFWKLRAQNRYAGFITPRYQFIAILFRLLTLEQSTVIF